MAVPSSGALSLNGIRRELETNDYNSAVSYTNTSLKDCSNGTVATINTNNASADRPDGSTPHAMSEFYSYDHDLASLTSFNTSVGASTPSNACALTQITTTRYHDGSNSLPVVGDTVFDDAGGTSPTADSNYKYTSGYFTITGGGGEVTATGGCRSERRLKFNIEFIGNSKSGIPMYHYEYKNPIHAPYGPGRYVGTMVDDLIRLGYSKSIIDIDGDIFVDYNQLDVDCKLIK